MEPKFKLGQDVYVIDELWYKDNIYKYTVTGMAIDRDNNLCYEIVSNGTTHTNENFMYATMEEAQNVIIKRIEQRLKNIKGKIKADNERGNGYDRL